MTTSPRISDTEWELMKVIWARGPCTAEAVIEALQRQDPTWHPKTAKTLLNRLIKKGALRFEKQGRAYLYHPRVTEEDSLDAVSQSFLDRLFGGSLRPMLAHFIERRKIGSREIRELRRLLDGGAGGRK